MNSTGCAILGANPRVSTFDGNDFLFNGLGDYWLVRSSQNSIDSSQFGLQIRMSPCDNSNPSSGTCVRGAAFSTTNNIIAFFVDPETGLITTTINGDIQSRDFHIGNYFDNYYMYVNPISVPGTSDIGYSVNIYYAVGNGVNRQFGVILGAKMGVNAWAVLSDSDFGAVSGLCGTFDGCMDNDFYSDDQMYVNTGDSAENIYTGFSETWRVQRDESYFGGSDFDQNTWYYQNYPEYAKNWTPRMDALEVTSDSAEACKLFADKSKYLY